MIAILVLSMVVGDVAVKSDDACVAADAIVAAIDATATLVPADDVVVRLSRVDLHESGGDTVDAEGVHATTMPWIVVVNATLARGAPLHRETRLRDVECGDTPALVALWLREHQRSTAAPLPDALDPISLDDVTTTTTSDPPPIEPAATTTTRATLPPVDPAARIEPLVPGASGCDGPPGCGGLGVDVGLGLSRRGAAVVGGVAWRFMPNLAAVTSAFVDANLATVGGAVGVGYQLHERGFDIRGTLAVTGGGSTSGVVDWRDDATTNCEDVTSWSRTKKTTSGLRAWAGPEASVRARWGWMFTEVGARYRVGVDGDAEVFGVVGAQLIGE
jgi:hypothetical protein